jgi:hypothetical protein
MQSGDRWNWSSVWEFLHFGILYSSDKFRTRKNWKRDESTDAVHFHRSENPQATILDRLAGISCGDWVYWPAQSRTRRQIFWTIWHEQNQHFVGSSERCLTVTVSALSHIFLFGLQFECCDSLYSLSRDERPVTFSWHSDQEVWHSFKVEWNESELNWHFVWWLIFPKFSEHTSAYLRKPPIHETPLVIGFIRDLKSARSENWDEIETWTFKVLSRSEVFSASGSFRRTVCSLTFYTNTTETHKSEKYMAWKDDSSWWDQKHNIWVERELYHLDMIHSLWWIIHDWSRMDWNQSWS